MGAATYTHREAFALMQYESDTGTSLHYIWNSRDGVTPFAVTIDGVEHRHVRWREDICAPGFQPPDDHLVFVTVHRTLDEWRVLATSMVERSPQYAPPPGEERDALIEAIAKGEMVAAGEHGAVTMTTGAEWRRART